MTRNLSSITTLDTDDGGDDGLGDDVLAREIMNLHQNSDKSLDFDANAVFDEEEDEWPSSARMKGGRRCKTWRWDQLLRWKKFLKALVGRLRRSSDLGGGSRCVDVDLNLDLDLWTKINYLHV